MIISGVSVAKKYAIAYLNVYQHALTHQDLVALETAYDFLKSHHDFMHLLCIFSLNKSEKNLVYKQLMHYFSLPQSFYLLIILLIKNKHIFYLKEVLQDICCVYKMRKNIVELHITTAVQLDRQTIQVFEQFFAQETGKKIETTVSLDRSLIAGVRLQSDFFVWEYSVASRLKALKYKLAIEG